MKCAAELNVSPLSFSRIAELIPTWTTKKEIRNKPVRPTINFLPMDDVKKFSFAIIY
jgi:hypothetical protein